MNIIKYVGSKNRISKDLAPIIQSYITNDTKGYLEPFVGGANMIDKIKCNNKVGCDIHEELNRQYIGFEIDKEYFDIANERINTYKVNKIK